MVCKKNFLAMVIQLQDNSPTNTFTTGRTLFTDTFYLQLKVLALNLDRLIMDKDRLLILHQQVLNQCAQQILPDPTIKLPNEHFDTFFIQVMV